MVKRAAVVLLGVAVLSAWGMPFHPPCCGFRDSARPMVEGNCCPVQGCPLAQARGAAPASIVAANSLDSAAFTSHVALTFASQVALVFSAASPPSSGLRPSPPRSQRPTPAFLSIFRI